MSYVIYALVAALILWSVVTVIRHVRRQLRGGCGCGCGCEGCPSRGSCGSIPKKK